MDYIKADSKNYGLGILDEKNVDPDPFTQFGSWLHDAATAHIPEYNAMTLATVDASGQPAARIVLLRHYDHSGLVFFTNYLSRKGQHLSYNNKAGLLFWWAELERQIRIEGTVEKISAAESDDYFATRPKTSQIGAWASEQSAIISERDFLFKQYEQFNQHYQHTVPRPPHWGGYCLQPQLFEFWQGQASRLHDRICYRFTESGQWHIARLAP